jgi:hypothetical protein
VNTELSTAILEKGVRRFPDNLQLKILLAYNYSYFEHRYRDAAELLDEAADLPGAPKYLHPLATRLFAASGAFDAGLSLAKSLLDSATSEDEREFYARRIKAIELERELTRVEHAVAEFKAQTQHLPKSVRDLVSAGFLAGPPVDPLGGTISVDSEGIAHSTSETHRMRAYNPDYDAARPEASP